MKTRVDEIRYPKTTSHNKIYKNMMNYSKNQSGIARRNGSTSAVRKSESKRTLVETLDLDDCGGYCIDDQEGNIKYMVKIPKDAYQKVRKLRNRQSQKFGIHKKDSTLSIAAMVSENQSYKSDNALEQVIEDLSNHNQDILQQAKMTVKDFQLYIEELLALNADMEARIFEYEEAYSLLQEEKIKLEEQLITANHIKQNQLKQSRQRSLKQSNIMLKKTQQMAEQQKKTTITINRMQKQKDKISVQMQSKDSQIKLLQQCLEGKQSIIKKMSAFNNQLCLELMELKNTQRNYLSNNQVQSQIQYQLSKKEKQILSLKQVNGLLRKQIFQFMKQNETVLINLITNLQRQRQKTALLEDQLIKEVEKKSAALDSFVYHPIQKSKSGKILKQKSLTPKSTFQNFLKTCQNVQKSSDKYMRARIIGDPSKLIEEYLMKDLNNPKQFLRSVNRIIKIFCKKIEQTEQICHFEKQVKNIQQSLLTLIKKKKQTPHYAEINFPRLNEQDRKTITHDTKDCIQKIQKRNEFIIKRINNFRTALEDFEKMQPFSPILNTKQTKFRQKKNKLVISRAEDEEQKMEDNSKNFDPNILKKFGNFAYVDYSFEPNN